MGRWIERRMSLAVMRRAFFLLVCLAALAPAAHAEPFRDGDVFAGVGDGMVAHYNPHGDLLEALDASFPGSETTGCTFDSAGNLYGTAFSAGGIRGFRGPIEPHTQLGLFGSGSLSGHPESMVFDNLGFAYVGAVDGDNEVRKFDPDGLLVKQFAVGTESRGSDWIDLSADRSTLFYTSEGPSVLRYDLINSQQLAPLTTALPGSSGFALRVLPDGSVLVANTQYVARVAPTGEILRTYATPEATYLFALNLDPDGKSFWTGDYSARKLFKFDLASGLVTKTIQTTGPNLSGICVYGELSAARQDSDGDGLPDEWEEKGLDFDRDGHIDVDLPALGAKKDHKDIFLHLAYLEKTGGFLGFGNHAHRPSENALNKLRSAFRNAPVANADGVSGITLHTRLGDPVAEDDANKDIGSCNGNNYDWSEFDGIKAVQLPVRERPVFHFALVGHDMHNCKGQAIGGKSRNRLDDLFGSGASDFVVAQGSGASDQTIAGTIMHELGHNLGLGHGGVEPATDVSQQQARHDGFKPNYLSVMNYSFQNPGLRHRENGKMKYGLLDYSRFGADALPDLDERTLDEGTGLRGSAAVKDYGSIFFCPNGKSKEIDNLIGPLNWDCKDPTGEVVTNLDINKEAGDPILRTAEEWSRLRFSGGAIGAAGATVELPLLTPEGPSPEPTLEQLAANRLPSSLNATQITATPADQLTLTAHLSATETQAAIGGASLVFRRAGNDEILCQAATDDDGNAHCDYVADSESTRSALLNEGYAASFAGDEAYQPSTALGAPNPLVGGSSGITPPGTGPGTPSTTPGPGTANPPAPPTGKGLKLSDVIRFSHRRCTPPRSIKLTIRKRKGLAVRRVNVYVGRRDPRIAQGKRLARPIVVSKLSRGRVTLRVKVSLKDGRVISGIRTLRGCG